MRVNKKKIISVISYDFSIGYPVVTLGFGVKSYVGYRIRHRKQREVAKENEFYMQLLQLALPNDDPLNDELLAQMRQTPEILHSEKLGDIDLPVSSAIIGMRKILMNIMSQITDNNFFFIFSTTYTTATATFNIECTKFNSVECDYRYNGNSCII